MAGPAILGVDAPVRRFTVDALVRPLDQLPPTTVADRVWSAFLVALGLAGLYYSKFLHVVFVDPHTNWFALWVGFSLVGCFVGVGVYVVVWSGLRKHISFQHWPTRHPILIPIATLCLFVSLFWFGAGIWPVYRWWTFLILPLWLSCLWNLLYLLP